MNKDDQLKVVIIGGGPAAIEAAKTAQLYSDNIKMISNKPSGDWGKLGWSNGLIEQCHERLTWKSILDKTNQKLESWSKNINKYLAKRKIETIIGHVMQVNPEYVNVQILRTAKKLDMKAALQSIISPCLIALVRFNSP